MDKFEEKNKTILENLYLMLNDEDVHSVITSVELFEYFKSLEGFELINEEFLKYNKKRIISDSYLPAYSLYPLKISQMLSFNVPCICGYYKDEKHP
jgi:hypothetical protein